MTGSPKDAVGGGPGAEPIPYSLPEATADSISLNASTPKPWHFKLPTLPGAPTIAAATPTVHVVILDTVPTPEDFGRAWATWGTSHDLIQRLLDPVNGKLMEGGVRRVEYAPYSHLLGLTDISLVDHPYVMSDHGLFVAGTINAIAPAAELHMVEVLNPYGVGTLQSFADGFARALAIAAANPTSPVIVNASLIMNLPQNTALLADLHDRVSDLAGMDASDIPTMNALLLALCNLLLDSDVRLVAAAGNDSTIEHPHPDARFPAAFDDVIGVSALQEDTTPASYSNQADSPVSAGIATFGGGISGEYTDGTTGMIGIYIGSFPDGTLSTSGWARWAGTSFSTPVITGVLANLAAQGPLTPDPLQPLRDAYTAADNTGVGEVFPVSQGA